MATTAEGWRKPKRTVSNDSSSIKSTNTWSDCHLESIYSTTPSSDCRQSIATASVWGNSPQAGCVKAFYTANHGNRNSIFSHVMFLFKNIHRFNITDYSDLIFIFDNMLLRKGSSSSRLWSMTLQFLQIPILGLKSYKLCLKLFMFLETIPS